MASVSAICKGGWRVKMNGTYYAFPVLLDLVRVPPVLSTCPVSLARAPMSATTTYDAAITVSASLESSSDAPTTMECAECNTGEALVPFVYDVVVSDVEYRVQTATILLYPNLPKQFTRMCKEGYGALIRRGGMPKVTHNASQVCCKVYFSDCTEPPSLCTGSLPVVSTKQSHPREVAKDRFMGQEPGDAETWLEYDTPCPYSFFSQADLLHSFEVDINTPGLCPFEEDGETPGTPDTCACFDTLQWRTFREMQGSYPSVDTRSSSSGNPDILEHLYHANATARWVNLAGCPHASFAYLTPPDSDTEYWKVDGAKQNVSVYFGKLREQEITFRGLLDADNKKTRNSVHSAPWLEGAHKNLFKTWFGTGESSWLGICRFVAQEVSVPSFALTSALPWTYENCSGALGANIVLTPSGTDIAAEADLAQFTYAPYCYGMIAASFGLNWVSTNISAISWYLVNQQGLKTLLATTTGTHTKPTATDENYAGSWAQDYGLGVASDTGADVAAGGLSAAAMASAELNPCYQLLLGWTAAKLRVEITVANPAVNVTLNYPVLYAPTTPSTVLSETGQVCAQLWELNGGIRYGQWDCWDGAAIRSQPIVRVPGTKATILDWLVWARIVWQGVAQTSGLNTEIDGLFDSVERGSDSSQKACTTKCHSFVVGGEDAISGVGCLVNSYREVPPLALFPRMMRDSNWEETGDWCQEACVFDIGPRYFINAQNEMHLDDAGGERWTTITTLGVGEWQVSEHDREVSNTEGATFSIMHEDGTEYANQSPYRGATAMLSPEVEEPDVEGENPFNLHLQNGMFLRSEILDGLVHVRRSLYNRPPYEVSVDVTSRADCAYPRLGKDSRGLVFCVFEEYTGGVYACYESRSDDDGETWNTEVSMGITNGRRPTINTNDAGTIVRAAFVYNSGSSGPGKIKGTYQHKGDASQSSVFTFKDSAAADMVFADDSFHISPSPSLSMLWLLSCRIDGETDPSDWYSADEGQTWTRIT